MSEKENNTFEGKRSSRRSFLKNSGLTVGGMFSVIRMGL